MILCCILFGAIICCQNKSHRQAVLQSTTFEGPFYSIPSLYMTYKMLIDLLFSYLFGELLNPNLMNEN